MVDYTNDLEAFFGLMKSQDGVIVQETPKFDLESYMQNYKGKEPKKAPTYP
jgi:COP9 signalosome complex subunit 1